MLDPYINLTVLVFIIAVVAMLINYLLGASGRLSLLSKILFLIGLILLGLSFIGGALLFLLYPDPSQGISLGVDKIIFSGLGILLGLILLVGGSKQVFNFMRSKPLAIVEKHYSYVDLRVKTYSLQRLIRDYYLVVQDKNNMEHRIDISLQGANRLMAYEPELGDDIRVRHYGTSGQSQSIHLIRGSETIVLS